MRSCIRIEKGLPMITRFGSSLQWAVHAICSLALVFCSSGCSSGHQLSEVDAEARDSDWVSFDQEAWNRDNANKADAPDSIDADQTTQYHWYAKCYCGDGWWSGPYRYQDQAERAARSHNCSHHWCAGCADVPPALSVAEGRDVDSQSFEPTGEVADTPPSEAFTMERNAATNRCNYAPCRDFGRVVPASHQHWLRCNHAACRDFGQYVSSGHKHFFRCNHAGCRDFGKYVAPRHQHWFRCNLASCRSFGDFVPPGHKHSRR
jgi:hypothetical protein